MGREERNLRKRAKKDLKEGKNVKPLTAKEVTKYLHRTPYFAGIIHEVHLESCFINSYPVIIIIYCDDHWISIYIYIYLF